MIGFISESAVYAFAHRRQRLYEERSLARARLREEGETPANKARLAEVDGSLEALRREARDLGIRIPGRYDVL